MRALALKAGVWLLLGGFPEKSSSPNRIRNTSVLLIEHHMDVVTSICNRVMVLSYGECIAQGEPRQAISEPRVVSAYLGERAAKRHAGAAA